ncbi:MAG: hypothetical protein KDK45_20740, partial [Leptospiraceae bacterium]|nr:hypothetical protein [Leptospiraceae bacterium]
MISLRSKPADIPVSIQQVIHTISGNSSELKELYSRAFRNLTLSISDYLGIRDLIVFFQTYKDSYSLHISLLLLYHFLNNGSICLSLHTETLKELLTKFELTDIVEKVALEIRNFFLQNKESELWVEYYEANPNSIQLARQRLLILYEYNKTKYLYFQKYFFHAYQLQENIQERLHTESNIQLRDKEFRDFLSLEKSLPVYSLNREQSLACILSNYVNT